jgi:hypothetical protein
MNITDSNPGRASAMSGPRWAPTIHDGLKLPSGATIGQTDNDALRREFVRLDVAGAATDGRNTICGRYAAMLEKIHDDAGAAAVAVWLQRNRG